MIKTGLNSFFFLLICFFAHSQTTFLRDVVPIIDLHCTSCHKKDGSAPFSLETYSDVTKRASFILEVIENKYMPPYPADPLFVEHANSNFLSKGEVATITKWIKEGKRKGKPDNENKPVAERESHPLKPDLILFRNQPYKIPGDNKERFKIFVVPTHLKKTTYIAGVEYVPGNARRTHHARMMIDTTNLLRKDDGVDVGDSSEFQRLGIKINDEFWKGWVPGNKTQMLYPEDMAKILPPQTDLVINTHYAASSLSEEDNFEVKLYFSKKKPKRLIQTFTLEEHSITNGPFILPPDSIVTFYMQSVPVPFDLSIINVLPHMHVLGKSFKAFAITPTGDVIPLISIPNWQFNWQLTYPFKYLLKIPKKSIIYVQATYDNTSHNLLNPNNPPKAVSYGWRTGDEMMNLIMEFVEYQQGDEKISTQQSGPGTK